MSTQAHFQTCPDSIRDEVAAAEFARLGLAGPEYVEGIYGLVENYITDSPGYVGPVVVILWPAGPGSVTTYIQNRKTGAWEFCNQMGG